MTVLGLLLAAGEGRRMGAPKALLRDPADVPFVDRAVGILFEGGCDRVTVVMGASSDAVRAVLDDAGWTSDPDVDTVVAEGWAEGMGASLRAGLTAASAGDASCALVSLVDLPDVGANVVRRVLDAVPDAKSALGRATYAGVPGHPVLIGRSHWTGVSEVARGDRGARDYLETHPHDLVECGDLASGRDVDAPEHL